MHKQLLNIEKRPSYVISHSSCTWNIELYALVQWAKMACAKTILVCFALDYDRWIRTMNISGKMSIMIILTWMVFYKSIQGVILQCRIFYPFTYLCGSLLVRNWSNVHYIVDILSGRPKRVGVLPCTLWYLCTNHKGWQGTSRVSYVA